MMRANISSFVIFGDGFLRQRKKNYRKKPILILTGPKSSKDEGVFPSSLLSAKTTDMKNTPN